MMKEKDVVKADFSVLIIVCFLESTVMIVCL
jgi:hypothetical protein